MKEKNKPQGKRHNEGRTQWRYLHPKPLEGLAKVFMNSANSGKYEPFNYTKGLSQTEIMESLKRHWDDYLSGEDCDHDSGLPLTWHIMANAYLLEFNRLFHPELDDRFFKTFQKQNKKDEDAEKEIGDCIDELNKTVDDEDLYEKIKSELTSALRQTSSADTIFTELGYVTDCIYSRIVDYIKVVSDGEHVYSTYLLEESLREDLFVLYKEHNLSCDLTIFQEQIITNLLDIANKIIEANYQNK